MNISSHYRCFRIFLFFLVVVCCSYLLAESGDEGTQRGVDSVYAPDVANMGLNTDAPPMEGEIFPVTRQRILNADDIQNWPQSKLQYAIYEMFARRNANFDNKNIKKTFLQFEWYTPLEGASLDLVEQRFSLIEAQNLKFLKNALGVANGSSTEKGANSQDSSIGVGQEEGKDLVLESVRSATFSNATMVSLGIKNSSQLPVKAFRITLQKLNDFDETQDIFKIQFSSDSIFRTPDPTTGHTIQPNEIIYYTFISTGEGYFHNSPAKIPSAKGRFVLQVEKVVNPK